MPCYHLEGTGWEDVVLDVKRPSSVYISVRCRGTSTVRCARLWPPACAAGVAVQSLSVVVDQIEWILCQELALNELYFKLSA